MSPIMLLMFFSVLILGTLITLSSSHWLLAWVGLEINTFAVIPLMAQNPHPRALEATLKYFIIQITATTMLLFYSTLNAWLLGQWEIQHTMHPGLTMLITIALALKLGLAPMHAWFPEILQGVSFKMGLILSTWQKLAPLSLFIQISNEHSSLRIILGLLSILIGGWGGLNQTQLRKILAYSSIAHLGWIILISHYLSSTVFLVFLIYMIMTSTLFLTFNHMGSTSINSLSTSWAKSPFLISMIPFTLFSLGGLPPFTGFISKWVIIDELLKQNLVLVPIIASLSSLLSLFFYLRLSYTISFTMPPNNFTTTLPWRLPFLYITPFLSLAMVASSSLLPISPSVLAFFLP